MTESDRRYPYFERKRLRVKLSPSYSGLPHPTYETSGSSGFDARACFESKQPLILQPFSNRIAVPTGLFAEIPHGYELQVRPRSGVSLKTNLLMPNSPGTIDSDYRGEIHVILCNMGNSPITIYHGDRIAQLVLCPVVRASLEFVSDLPETERGANGFGSTGGFSFEEK